MNEFVTQISDHASSKQYTSRDLGLFLSDWQPRIKAYGKTLGHREWIKIKADWEQELGGKLTEWHVAFLELVFTQPALFKALKDDARVLFKDHFAGEPGRRVMIKFHALSLPKLQDETWNITLNDGTAFGPVVVLEMCGWSIQGSTLVG